MHSIDVVMNTVIMGRMAGTKMPRLNVVVHKKVTQGASWID
jgi:hypothetical protein